MKKIQLISLIAMLSLLVSAAPASALSFDSSLKTNATIQTNSGYNDDRDGKDDSDRNDDRDDDKNDDRDDKRFDDRWNHWMFHSGIAGTVTAENDSSIMVKARNGTSYTVDIDDAKLRYVGEGNSSIEVGDMVFVQGVINGSSVVASVVVDTKAKVAPEPNDDEKRTGIAGTITAKSGTTITVIGKNGTTYIVATADAKIWKNKNETSSVSNLSVGDTVIVQGSVSGSNVTAVKIYAISIPQDSSDGGIRGTVTAINGNTITILATGGSTYTVDVSDAKFKDGKNEDSSIGDIKVGQMITVQGDVNGSTIDAEVVNETEIKRGWFHRFGQFWKNIFGKKNAELKMNGEINSNR